MEKEVVVKIEKQKQPIVFPPIKISIHDFDALETVNVTHILRGPNVCQLDVKMSCADYLRLILKNLLNTEIFTQEDNQTMLIDFLVKCWKDDTIREKFFTGVEWENAKV